MKKTVSVNIRGLNFIIEEDAYELLQDYLDRLSRTLKNEEGNREIIEDIELRIAELCSQKLNPSKTVIELADISDIIATMGDPSQYIDEEDSTHTMNDNTRTESKETTSEHTEKRLFRDTENAVIAGVCSGIASFFKIDVVIIRAIFVIMFLFAGFGFPLYLILWIIVPRTRNTIDRLRMKGKPITVESVKEEVEMAAENINKGSRKFAKQIRNDDTYAKQVNKGIRVIATIFGAGLIFLGVLFLIPLLIFLIGGFEFIPVANESGFLSFPEFGELVLTEGKDFTMMSVGILLFSFSTIIFLILSGTLFVFSIKNRWAKFCLLLLFLSGITGGIVAGSAGISTGKDFIKGSNVEVEVGSVDSHVLYIIPKSTEQSLLTNNGKRVFAESGMMEVADNEIKLYGIHMRYIKSQDSLFHIKKTFSARGRSHNVATRRSDNINHDTKLNGDTLNMDTFYSFPQEDKLRDQEVEVIVEIPKGGMVRIKDRIITLDGIESPDEDEHPDQDGYIKANGRYKHYN